MNEMRKLMETIEKIDEEYEDGYKTLLPNTIVKLSDGVKMTINVINYKDSKYVDDGTMVNISDGEYMGMNLQVDIKDFNKIVNLINSALRNK